MPGMSSPTPQPPKQPQHELKAISGAIIALVGAVILSAIMHSTASLPGAIAGVIALGLLVVGLVTWLYQILQT